MRVTCAPFDGDVSDKRFFHVLMEASIDVKENKLMKKNKNKSHLTVKSTVLGYSSLLLGGSHLTSPLSLLLATCWRVPRQLTFSICFSLPESVGFFFSYVDSAFPFLLLIADLSFSLLLSFFLHFPTNHHSPSAPTTIRICL